MNRTDNRRKRGRAPAPASRDLNALAIAFLGETQFIRLGGAACMLRHFKSGIGGGLKPKRPGKIATLLSATAIIIASGFGAPAAVGNKELNPKADIKKYSFDHPAKLKWLFDEDPGSLKIELGSKHHIAKIRPTDHLESTTDIIGGQRPGRFKAKVIKGSLCQLKEGDVADMSLDLPPDFHGWRQDLPNLYDATNIFNMEIGREYYVIASCASYGPRLAYIIE